MRIVAGVITVLIVVVYAVGSGRFVTTNTSWYLALDAPPWQPPNAVFGIAWTYNFIALAIVGILMAIRAEPAALWTYVGAFAVSVIFALTWSYLFYVPHALLASAIALTLCALVTLAMVIPAFSQQPLLGWLLIPYQVWLVIASSLSWGYWVLNRVT